MIKIRALNDACSGGESEDEDNPKLSLEAQEAQAKAMYEKAQILTKSGKWEDAVETFGEILEMPYLNGSEEDHKSLSPVQLQLRLGCLKCLSTLYTRGPTLNLEHAATVLELITDIEPHNVNFWYRFGKVALQLGKLEAAFDAFQQALECSPGHWGSIEQLVTVSYALHDVIGCLRYCSLGLSRDPEFLRGRVFKDHLLKTHSWAESVVKERKEEFEGLFVESKQPCVEHLQSKYIQEARDLMTGVAGKYRQGLTEKDEEESRTLVCPLKMETLSLLDLGKLVHDYYRWLQSLGLLLRTVDMSTVLPEEKEPAVVPEPDITNAQNVDEAAAMESESQASQGMNGGNSGGGNDSSKPGNENSQVSECEEKMLDEEDSQAPGQQEDDSSSKKKIKKDLKWWQLEGQRRSTRVQRNIVTAPTKPKPESTFAELLRNIIPSSLITDETAFTRDQHRKGKNTGLSSTSSVVFKQYFNTSEEEEDVKKLILRWQSVNILDVVTDYVSWIAKHCPPHWSQELQRTFIELSHIYQRIHISCFVPAETLTSQYEDDIFVILTDAEINFELNPGKCFSNTIPVLETALQVLMSNTQFLIRFEWLKFKLEFHKCKGDVQQLSYTKDYLQAILKILSSQPEGFSCFTPNAVDFVISLTVVQDKLQYLQKIENISRVEELYKSKQYHDLVQILQFSFSNNESASEDVLNRLYLAESLIHLDNIECVQQIEFLANPIVKSGSEERISLLLNLCRTMWDTMKSRMAKDDCNIIVNAMLKILIHVEKQQDRISNEFMLSEPWCILHSVVHHVEKQSDIPIDEENVPSSVSVLQMGHEILSKFGKCCVDGGRFLSYLASALLELQHVEEYWAFEETKNCMDQAILCLFNHPSKKFKLRTVKDHGSSGTPLTWDACLLLYSYFKPEELPEFDSKTSKSITAETENLMQRIVAEIPPSMQPLTSLIAVKNYIEGIDNDFLRPSTEDQRPEIMNIYYLLADYYFKNQEMEKAMDFYQRDLAICPRRFDSWAAIALMKVENIIVKINACEAVTVTAVMKEADIAIRCFEQALLLDAANSKIRIEFGTFLYSLHSVLSRELKYHFAAVPSDLVEDIKKKQMEYLCKSQSLFQPFKASSSDNEENVVDEDDAWINHYMLGKVAEKLYPDCPEKCLAQYEMALNLLHEQCSNYPYKINYYSPPDYVLETLEVYFRIHAYILKLVKQLKEMNKDLEQTLLRYLRVAETSPFVKSKPTRGQDGESKRKRGGEDAVSKKEMSIIRSVLNELLEKVEKVVSEEQPESPQSSTSTTSSSDSSSSTSDEEETNQGYSSPTLAPMKSLSLAAFRERIQEEQQQQVRAKEKEKEKAKDKEQEKDENDKIAEKQKYTSSGESETTKICQEDKLLENNQYYPTFSDLPYGLVISVCLKALRECVTRCPQYFKAFYRIADTYFTFKQDFKIAKDYLLGNSSTGQEKITGLYGERKPSNFFHGIWRHPIDDVDRPGSFAFYMAKSMKLLLQVLSNLNDHQMLAEVGIQLGKVPDSKNTYLYTEDREAYCKEAFKLCSAAANKVAGETTTESLIDCGISIYETHTKFQKFSPKDNVVASTLLQMYKKYIVSHPMYSLQPAMSFESVSLGDALKFFQHVVWNVRTTGTCQKPVMNHQRQSAGDLITKPAAENKVMKSSGEGLTSKAPKPQSIARRNSTDAIAAAAATSTVPPLSGIFGSTDISNQIDLVAQLASFNKALQMQFASLLSKQPGGDSGLGQLLESKTNQRNIMNGTSKPRMANKTEIPMKSTGNRPSSSSFKSNDTKPIKTVQTNFPLPPKNSLLSSLSDLNSKLQASKSTGINIEDIQRLKYLQSAAAMNYMGNVQKAQLSGQSGFKKPDMGKSNTSQGAPSTVTKDQRKGQNSVTGAYAPSTSRPKPKVSSTQPSNLMEHVAPSFSRSSPFQQQTSPIVIPSFAGLGATHLVSSSSLPKPHPAHTQGGRQPGQPSNTQQRKSAILPPSTKPRLSMGGTNNDHDVVDLTTKSPDKLTSNPTPSSSVPVSSIHSSSFYASKDQPAVRANPLKKQFVSKPKAMLPVTDPSRISFDAVLKNFRPQHKSNPLLPTKLFTEKDFNFYPNISISALTPSPVNIQPLKTANERPSGSSYPNWQQKPKLASLQQPNAPARPQKRPGPPMESTSPSYPLPPKKKQYVSVSSPVNTPLRNDDPEVIFLD